MNYELELHESLGEGTKRIIAELVSAVHDSMIDPQPTREEAVHEARKSFKRIRAALRLARNETGQTWYRRENAFYRDSSRMLAPVRDSTVLVLTLDAVTEAYANIVPPETFASIRQKLEQRHEDIVQELLDNQDVMATVARRMEAGLDRLQEMPVSSEEFEIYGEGLRRVYRRGRQAMQRALDDPEDPVKFHEWRKRVKYLWYHMDTFQQAWPVVLGDLANELHLLSDFLGDAHDLVVLKETLLAEPELAEGNQNLTTLLALIDRRRQSLEEASWTLGQRLYVERPGDFVRRIQTYWDAWQRDTPATRTALQKSLQEKEELEVLKKQLLDGSSLLSTREAATELGTTVGKIRKDIKKGRLQAEKVGRFWVIRKDSLADRSAN
jgi:excisionase family DNA binding protein